MAVLPEFGSFGTWGRGKIRFSIEFCFLVLKEQFLLYVLFYLVKEGILRLIANLFAPSNLINFPPMFIVG